MYLKLTMSLQVPSYVTLPLYGSKMAVGTALVYYVMDILDLHNMDKDKDDLWILHLTTIVSLPALVVGTLPIIWLLVSLALSPN